MVVFGGDNKEGVGVGGDFAVADILALRVVTVAMKRKISWIDKNNLNVRERRTKFGDIMGCFDGLTLVAGRTGKDSNGQ